MYLFKAKGTFKALRPVNLKKQVRSRHGFWNQLMT